MATNDAYSHSTYWLIKQKHRFYGNQPEGSKVIFNAHNGYINSIFERLSNSYFEKEYCGLTHLIHVYFAINDDMNTIVLN